MGWKDAATGAGSGAAAGLVGGPWGAGLGAAAGFFGGLFGRKQQQQTTRMLPPHLQGMENMLLQNLQARMGQGLPDQFEERGIGAINSTFEDVNRGVGNSLISRGLSSSPMAGAADRNLGFARAGEIGRFRAGLPTLERQFENENLSMMAQLLQSRLGVESEGSTGGGLGGGLEGLGGMLGFLMSQGAFGQQQQQQGFGTPFTVPPLSQFQQPRSTPRGGGTFGLFPSGPQNTSTTRV